MAKKATRLLLWTTGIGLFILCATAAAAVLLADAEPPGFEQDPEWLHIKLSGSLRESPGAENLLVDPVDMPPLTTEVASAIRHAAQDDDVKGIFLELYPVSLGWASTQEIRDAISELTAAGKPCRVWADTLMNKEYYLASACSEIYVAPNALMLVNGLAVTRSYYKGTFEKIGVKPNFEHVGDFKSAVEPYERTGPSEAAQQADAALLDSLYGQMVQGMADGRGVDLDVARGWVDDPPVSPEAAVEAGMLDGARYRDEIEGGLEGEPRSLMSYLRDLRQEWTRGGDRVAVIYAEGAIISGSSSSDFFGSQYVGDRTLRKHLKEAREDESVKAVVLRVNSPGGSGQASDAIWRDVGLTQEVKPVIVSMGDYAASGGYYISMGSSRIFAEPGTITGSIGVFGGKMNLAGAYEKVGVTLHTEQRGRYANLFGSTSDFDELERQKYQEFLSSFYTTFVSKAAEGRETTYDALHEVAQGRVWTGEQALELDLIDELGGLDAAVAHAASEGGIEGDVRIVRMPERKGFLDALLEELSNPEDAAESSLQPGAAALQAIPEDVRAGLGAVERLERIAGGGGAIALLPGAPAVR